MIRRNACANLHNHNCIISRSGLSQHDSKGARGSTDRLILQPFQLKLPQFGLPMSLANKMGVKSLASVIALAAILAA